jgi:hypothetical protein
LAEAFFERPILNSHIRHEGVELRFGHLGEMR